MRYSVKFRPSEQAKAFSQIVRARHSVRQFLPRPVPSELMECVLADAQCSPSNRNTQPWQVHILSGAIKDRFCADMIAAAERGQRTADFSWNAAEFHGALQERSQEHGKVRYDAMGIAREDHAARRHEDFRNLELFGAPHVALLFMPSVGDCVRVAGDIGMYAQTFLLSLTAHGLGGIPQTSLGFHAGVARRLLGLPEEQKLLFGIAFGYEDLDSVSNSYRMPRATIDESVVFHQ